MFRIAVAVGSALLMGGSRVVPLPSPDAGAPMGVHSMKAEVDAPPRSSTLVTEKKAELTEEAQLISLETIVSTPPDPFPSTAMVRMRSQPKGGERERIRDVAVVSRCDERSCLDGLRDLRTGRDLLSPEPTRSEKEVLDASGSVQRVVKLAHVGEDFVSVYMGSTELSGGAHANNNLRCATYDRRTGRPVELAKIVPRAETRILLQRASERLRTFLHKSGQSGYRLSNASFLYDAASARITFCAEAPTQMAGTIIVIPLRKR